MSSKPHYFAIGLFVIVTTALGLIGIVLFSSDSMSSPENFIETYIDESVQGIEVGTPFKLRGVKVGSVCEIAMVSSIYDTEKMYVMIRVALDKKAMDFSEESLQDRVNEQVDNGLRLKLVPQGITGLSFLEANMFPETDSNPLEIDWEPHFIYVPSTPATMTLVSRSLSRLSAQLDTIDLTSIGNNIESITSNLNVSVVHIEELTGNAAEASAEVIGNVRAASADLPTMTANLTDTTEQLDALIKSSGRDVDQVMENLRYITDDTRELIRMLKRHPGMLLSEPPDKNLSRGGKK